MCVLMLPRPQCAYANPLGRTNNSHASTHSNPTPKHTHLALVVTGVLAAAAADVETH